MRLVASGQPKTRISTASSELRIALEDVKRIVLLNGEPDQEVGKPEGLLK